MHYGIKHKVAGACARWLLLRRTSENSVKAKFVRNVYYDVGLIRASRKAEADF
jgi:hypothetical protein